MVWCGAGRWGVPGINWGGGLTRIWWGQPPPPWPMYVCASSVLMCLGFVWFYKYNNNSRDERVSCFLRAQAEWNQLGLPVPLPIIPELHPHFHRSKNIVETVSPPQHIPVHYKKYTF